MIADLVVFDPETVSPGMPVAANDLPVGPLRLKQMATGLAASVVGGKVVMRNNEPTGRCPAGCYAVRWRNDKAGWNRN